MSSQAVMTAALRTWDGGKRCDECCNGDRCDDLTHSDRANCRHCKATGWALWTDVGRADYAKYLQGWRRMSEQEALAEVARVSGFPSPEQAHRKDGI